MVLLGLAAWVAAVGGQRIEIGDVRISIRSPERLALQGVGVFFLRHLFVARAVRPAMTNLAASLVQPVVVAVVFPMLVYLAIVAKGYDGGAVLRGDALFYYYAAESLVEDGDLDLWNQMNDPARVSEQVSRATDGRLVPKHPILLPLLSAPIISVFGERGALLFNLLQIAALLAVIYRLAARTASRWAAAFATAATATLSFMPHYVYNFSADICSTLLLAAALLAMPRSAPHAAGRHALAGLLGGLVVASKYVYAVFLPGIPFLLIRPLGRSLLPLVAAAAVPIGLMMALNAHLFGSPFTTSYHHIVGLDDAGRAYEHAVTSSFRISPLVGGWGQLFDPVHGLVFSSPVTMVSFAGLFWLARRDRALAWYLGLSWLALFLVFATYEQWNSSHAGNRFLMPIVALAAIPLANLIEQIQAWRERAPDPLPPPA